MLHYAGKYLNAARAGLAAAFWLMLILRVSAIATPINIADKHR
jgi:hypothetical protein